MQTYNSIIDTINNLNNSFSFGIFVPSLQRDVQFHQMTTAQQKAFIKNSMIDGAAGTSSFVYAVHNLIKTNCADETVNVNDLTILDKIFICLMIRILSIGNTLSVVVGADSEKDIEGNRVNIDLLSLYNKMKNEYGDIPVTQIIKSEASPYEIEISLPTLGDELTIEKQLQEKLKNSVSENSQKTDVATTVGELFIQEIVKFIRKITIKQEDTEPIEINMYELTPKQRVSIIEKIPSNIMSPAIVQINKMIEKSNKLSVFDINIGDKHYDYRVEVLNGDFFTDSLNSSSEEI